MVYADFEYYSTDYLLGKEAGIPEEVFLFWEKQARQEIDARTFECLKANPALISEKVKECTCAVAELLYKANSVAEQALQEGGAGPLASYSNDGESGTYDLQESVYTESGKRKEVRRLVNQYLGNTGLLYAGVRRCES